MSELCHPNLVQFIGMCLQPSPNPEDNHNIPVLVMELLPMSLTNYLEKYENIPANVKNSILLDVSLGLLYLHNQSPPVVHRDLTANNVLLTSGLKAKIADFGVSKTVEPDVRQHYFRVSQNPGNLCYMPPETMSVAKVENISNVDKLDVFSFGVLIAHTFSQKWPTPTGSFDADMVPLTEVQKRMKYIDAIDDDVVKKLAEDCLHNLSKKRPHTSQVVAILQDICSQSEPVETLMENKQQLSLSEANVVKLRDEIRENTKGREELQASLSQEKVKVVNVETQLLNEKKERMMVMRKLSEKHEEECKMREAVAESLRLQVEEKMKHISSLQVELRGLEEELTHLRAQQLQPFVSREKDLEDLPFSPPSPRYTYNKS